MLTVPGNDSLLIQFFNIEASCSAACVKMLFTLHIFLDIVLK
jgi:hypothetical protein